MQTFAVVQEMMFKDISILVLGAIVQQSITICAIFGRRRYKAHFCEIIWNSGQRFMRYRLQIFLL